MGRESCRDSALVRSYARKAGGDGLRKRTSQCGRRPRFRDEAPHRQTAHARCSHRVWRAYGAAARVLTRAVAARSSLRGRRFLAAARPMARPVSQLSALPRHAWSHNRSPRSRRCGEWTVRACPSHCNRPTHGPSHGNRPTYGASRFATARSTARPAPTAVYPRSFGRQRFSSTQRTKKRPAERWSL